MRESKDRRLYRLTNNSNIYNFFGLFINRKEKPVKDLFIKLPKKVFKRKVRRVEGGQEWIAGVCAGVAYSIGMPVWIVRLLVFLTIFALGAGLLVYAALAIFMPAWKQVPSDFDEVTGD